MKILFVCLGNICRSPMAEGILRHMLKEKNLDHVVTVHSAGTEHYHIGNPADKRATRTAMSYGVDIRSHKARQIVAHDFHNYDRIYSMATDVHKILMKLAPKDLQHKAQLFMDVISPGSNQSVPDPWYGSESGFKPVYELIREGCFRIVNDIEKELKHT